MARRARGTDSCVLVLYTGALQACCNQRRAHVVHPVSAGTLPAAAPRERARGRRDAVGAGEERGGAPRRARGSPTRRMQTLPVRWRAPAPRWHWHAPARELTLCQLWTTAQRRRAARTEHEITRGFACLRRHSFLPAFCRRAQKRARAPPCRTLPGPQRALARGARAHPGRGPAVAAGERAGHSAAVVICARGGARPEDAGGACQALAGGSALRLSQPWAP